MSTAAAPYPAELNLDTAKRVARVGDWDRLFDMLETAGCELGVEGRMRVLGLAGRLVAAGADLDDPDVLRAHLAPIVAIGRDNVAEIGEVIAKWRAASGAKKGRSPKPAEQAQPGAITAVRRADQRWLAIGGALALAALTVWGATWTYHLFPSAADNGRGPGVPPGQGGPDWPGLLKNVAARVVFALPLLFAGFLLVGWRNAAGDRLVRRAGTADWSELFTLAAEVWQWFEVASPRRLFETLKQPKQEPLTDRIDTPASVRATLRAGMWPKIEYRLKAESLNYVVLVDRRAAGDHVELLAQSLTDALGAAKIRFAQYEFRGRPAFCTPVTAAPAPRSALSLRILAKRHAGERILMVSDGEFLFESPGWRFLPGRRKIFIRPGTPVAEMGNLRDFGHATLMTPTPQSAWGERERMLEDLGFQVVPASADGIMRIGLDIACGEEFATQVAGGASEDSFLARLSIRAMNYASNRPPPPQEITNLVMDIRIWLVRMTSAVRAPPNAAFLVLCGVAAFPTIAPGLTVEIARLLTRRPGKENPPVNSALLGPLARLPWLRDGRMPDWLRIALLGALDEAEFKRIRALQVALLDRAEPVHGSIEAADLERLAATFDVAVGESDRALDEAAARIAPGAPGDEVERIFLATLRGERLDPVEDVIKPEAPEAVRERLGRPERFRRAAWIVTTGAVACAVALAEPTLAGSIASGWQKVVDFAGAHPLSLKLVGFDLAPWLGAASTVAAASLLATWLVRALLRLEARAVRLALNLRLPFPIDAEFSIIADPSISLPYLAMVPIILAAAFVLVDPAAARMPLLFALATPIFLFFAPSSQTPGAKSAVELLPQRLVDDDWIATTLGGVALAIAGLGPVFLFALPSFADRSRDFTLQLAAVLVGATTWGLGSRYVRRQLLGPIEGRPTANERWLDFIAPGLSLLLLAASMPMLASLGIQGNFSGGFIGVWLGTIGLIGVCLIFLTLRLKAEYNILLRYLVAWMALLAFIPYYASVETQNSSNDIVVATTIVVPFTVIAVNINLINLKYLITIVLISACAVFVTLLVIGIVDIIFYRGAFERLFDLDFLRLLILLLIGCGLFWPSLRFILMPSRPAPEQPFLRWAWTGLGSAITSPWWFVPVLLPIVCRYQVFGFDIALAPLAAPLAVAAGWLCGPAAAIPVLVGSLPFAAELNLSAPPAIATPGGLWPIAVLPMLTRFVADEALRGRILGRRRASLWDCGLFFLCLATTAATALLAGVDFVLSVDPTWLAMAVGFLVGASRMRWREPSAIVGAGAVAAFLGLGTARSGTGLFALFAGLDAVGLLAALATASFFGGRVWRSFVFPDSADERGVSAGFGLALMVAAAGIASLGQVSWSVTNILTHTHPGVRFVTHEAPLLLTAMVVGLIVRKSPSLAAVTLVLTAVITITAVLTTAMTAPVVILARWLGPLIGWVVIFALFGFAIDRWGEAAYARALGLLPRAEPQPSSMSGETLLVRRVLVEGRVAGVGYRDFTRRTALRLNVSGWVRNRADGTVEALVSGAPADVEALIAEMRRGPRGAKVTSLSLAEADDAAGTTGGTFAIRPS
jgi:acylphosphatase